MTMENQPPVIRIIDDDPSMRAALADLLASMGYATRGYQSVAAFVGADDDLPGCMLLDVRMPGEGGLAFFESDAFGSIGLPAIFVSGHGDVAMAVRAMRQGAIDFLTKPFDDQALLDAVNRAVGQDAAARLERAADADLRARYGLLNAGERDVLRLIVDGKSNKEAALALGFSEITVKVRRGSVMRKLEAQSLPDLVRLADRLGHADRT